MVNGGMLEYFTFALSNESKCLFRCKKCKSLCKKSADSGVRRLLPNVATNILMRKFFLYFDPAPSPQASGTSLEKAMNDFSLLENN